MARETVRPTLNEYGHETHPAWGLISAHRGSVMGARGGAVLFDSDIAHQHTVTVRISTASRSRTLHRDHLMGERAPFVEVEMSEAQWASFVSSMNAGEGVPCTIRRREHESMPEVPFEPRLAESMDEARRAADKAAAEVAAAFAAYKAHKTAANLRSLQAAIENMPSNVKFAAKSLSEHAENVVQRARADIEAMVVAKAEQLGLDAAELGVMPQLEAGDDDSEVQ